jgi:hypothetical protein
MPNQNDPGVVRAAAMSFIASWDGHLKNSMNVFTSAKGQIKSAINDGGVADVCSGELLLEQVGEVCRDHSILIHIIERVKNSLSNGNMELGDKMILAFFASKANFKQKWDEVSCQICRFSSHME